MFLHLVAILVVFSDDKYYIGDEVFLKYEINYIKRVLLLLFHHDYTKKNFHATEGIIKLSKFLKIMQR